MEANTTNLNLEDEEEELIPCERDPNKEDDEYRFCLVGKALMDCRGTKVYAIQDKNRCKTSLEKKEKMALGQGREGYAASSRNELVRSKWLREEVSSRLQMGNSFIGIEIDIRSRGGIERDEST
ncbi:hypothetical protein Goari_004923 [Gossypium aridum]|uniref:Uncharacterized protein n=1 Tax=Gossypium aridum TaxID=34290 RepID=A0A7J8Y500_GOSAI|nr:hypothetical protein [Gossypium aridum]